MLTWLIIGICGAALLAVAFLAVLAGILTGLWLAAPQELREPK